MENKLILLVAFFHVRNFFSFYLTTKQHKIKTTKFIFLLLVHDSGKQTEHFATKFQTKTLCPENPFIPQRIREPMFIPFNTFSRNQTAKFKSHI
jgi:hypothetical protein